jgi:dATP pyrophosphohydrolase
MAARREAWEEAGLPRAARLYQLQAMDTVPVVHFQGRETWPSHLCVVPQFSFGLDATDVGLVISQEPTQFGWFGYADAAAQLACQSNAVALWELHERLTRHDLPPTGD